MGRTAPTTAILHYSAPPVVGGVEAVIDAHARVFVEKGYPVSIIAGQGSAAALPRGCELILISELDSQHPDILAAGSLLETGQVPGNFTALTERLRQALAGHVRRYDNVIVHNVFTKHFNLPLTAAVFDLLDAGAINHCIAWHHDLTWTSPRSRAKVYPGYPWDLLRTYRPDVTHVTISKQRQKELAGLYGCDEADLRVIYNGIDPIDMFGFTVEGRELVARLGLLAADLILLMPVRVTRAKNIEYALALVAALKTAGIAVKLVHTGPPDPHDEKSMAYFRALQKRRDDLDLQEALHFVFESGPDPAEPYLISLPVVYDLYRVADVMFMPSHQEGFGMPVLEAGLVRLPVVASETVPAAQEIGGDDVYRFALEQSPQDLAQQLISWVSADRRTALARRVRQEFTWEALFNRQIAPLLKSGDDP